MKKLLSLTLAMLLVLTCVTVSAEGQDELTGTYTFYNRTGETVTELYLIDNLTGEKGDNYAADGFADGTDCVVTRTITAEEKDAGYSMTVYFKTEGSYEAQYATLHLEAAPVTLLAADAMTGPTPISFFKPIEAILPELEDVTINIENSLGDVPEAILPELEDATITITSSLPPVEGPTSFELEDATITITDSLPPVEEAVVSELEDATITITDTLPPVEEAVVSKLEDATITITDSLPPVEEAVVSELEDATITITDTLPPVEEAVVSELEDATINITDTLPPVEEAVVSELEDATIEAVTMDPIPEAILPNSADTKAGTVLTETAKFPGNGGAGVIRNSNYLNLGSYRKNALAKPDGTILTEEIYSDLESASGYFTACLGTGGWTYGLLDAEGNIIIPFEYADVKVLSDTWAVAITINENGTEKDYDYYLLFSNSNYGLIDRVDLYNLKEAKKVETFTRDHYADARANGEILHIYDRSEEKTYEYDASFHQVLRTPRSFYDFPNETPEEYQTFYLNGKYGLKTPQNEVVLDAEYDYIYTVADGYAKIQIGDKYGIVCVDGSLAVPAEYDELPYISGSRPTGMKNNPYVYFGYAPVTKDGITGFYSLKDASFSEIPLKEGEKNTVYGISALVEESDGIKTIFAADGTVARMESYSSCYSMDYTLGRYYKVSNSYGNYGVVNWRGEEVLPCEYSSIQFTADGRLLVAYQSHLDTVTVFEVSDILSAE